MTSNTTENNIINTDETKKENEKVLLSDYLSLKANTDLLDKFTFIFLRIVKYDLQIEINEKNVDELKREFIPQSIRQNKSNRSNEEIKEIKVQKSDIENKENDPNSANNTNSENSGNNFTKHSFNHSVIVSNDKNKEFNDKNNTINKKGYNSNFNKMKFPQNINHNSNNMYKREYHRYNQDNPEKKILLRK